MQLNNPKDPLLSKRRWGHLTLVEESREPVTATDSKGEVYIVNSFGPVIMRLRCDCGYEWDLHKADFPGRRLLRSCGRPQCPHTPRPKFRRPPGQRGSCTTIYLSNDIQQQLRELAEQKQASYSSMIEDIVRRFFVDRFIEQ